MKKRVLIIEDNEKNLELERFLMEAAGFEVLEALHATGGIAVARQEQPDTIIMDVRLADMRGIEAAKILRGDEVTRNIPIVFVTASVLEETIEEIKSMANSIYISKPINTRTFAQEISDWIKCISK